MVLLPAGQLQCTLENLTFQPIKISGNNIILLFDNAHPGKIKDDEP
jgi:hypothetical protein